MAVFSGFQKARQLSLYFQQYGELPGVKKEEVGTDEVFYDFDYSRGRLDEYRSIDNSLQDYDTRTGHLLLAEEPSGSGPMQISYQGAGDGKQAKLSRLYLSEPSGCFNEDHYIFTDDRFHSLKIFGNRNGYYLEALTLNRLEPTTALCQKLRFKA